MWSDLHQMQDELKILLNNGCNVEVDQMDHVYFWTFGDYHYGHP